MHVNWLHVYNFFHYLVLFKLVDFNILTLGENYIKSFHAYHLQFYPFPCNWCVILMICFDLSM